EDIAYIKKIWLEMCFVDMRGSMVQTAFWDLDALFVPQDHPAREMQDTFYLKGAGTIPAPLAKKVKATHESGGTTGSRGWGGQWSEDVARQLLLRTHTTVLSAQTIARLKETDVPAKFFAVGRVFRNETLDWKHLFEFHQVEGIVVDPDANLRQLIKYLREFYTKMGYADVRLRPAHFPYTEPSLEVEVLHPIRKEWIELGGAGIFRPEVTQPIFGTDIPVLAWGQGMERIITEYYKFQDLREMYTNDVDQLRSVKAWMR
ncbi:MAG: phenylalanine--tRNA ligase subunit alpha, partial [Nanoarchaeota archaeon]